MAFFWQTGRQHLSLGSRIEGSRCKTHSCLDWCAILYHPSKPQGTELNGMQATFEASSALHRTIHRRKAAPWAHVEFELLPALTCTKRHP